MQNIWKEKNIRFDESFSEILHSFGYDASFTASTQSVQSFWSIKKLYSILERIEIKPLTLIGIIGSTYDK